MNWFNSKWRLNRWQHLTMSSFNCSTALCFSQRPKSRLFLLQHNRPSGAVKHVPQAFAQSVLNISLNSKWTMSWETVTYQGRRPKCVTTSELLYRLLRAVLMEREGLGIHHKRQFMYYWWLCALKLPLPLFQGSQLHIEVATTVVGKNEKL